MPQQTTFGEQYPAYSQGPSVLGTVPDSVHGLGSSVASSGSATSNLIYSDGFQAIAVGVTSTQGGLITVQRYLDDAGTVPQGPPLTAVITADVAANLNVADGLPFASFTVQVSNSGGADATLSNLAIVLQGIDAGASLSAPAARAAAVTPSDTNPLSADTRALFVGGAGDIALVTSGGDSVTFTGVLAGSILSVRAHQIKATGTTASNIIALW